MLYSALKGYVSFLPSSSPVTYIHYISYNTQHFATLPPGYVIRTLQTVTVSGIEFPGFPSCLSRTSLFFITLMTIISQWADVAFLFKIPVNVNNNEFPMALLLFPKAFRVVT